MSDSDFDYEVQGNYGYGHGYECVSTESNKADALATLKVYRENEPGTPFRIRRVKAES